MLIDDDDGVVVVVDFGDVVLVFVFVDQGLCVDMILFIYYYDDYIGGVFVLQICFFGVWVIVFVEECIFMVIEWVGEGECVQVLGWMFYVLFVFGYICSYIVFYIVEYFFSGDLLFSLGCGCLFEGMLFQLLVLMCKLGILFV